MTEMRLAEIYERIVDEKAGVGFRAYDGSTAGPMSANPAAIATPRAA